MTKAGHLTKAQLPQFWTNTLILVVKDLLDNHTLSYDRLENLQIDNLEARLGQYRKWYQLSCVCERGSTN